MRGKNKYCLMAVLVLLVSVLTGCTPTQLGYWEAMRKTDSWEQVGLAQDFTTTVHMGPDTFIVKAQTTAEMNTQTAAMLMNMNIAIEGIEDLEGQPIPVDLDVDVLMEDGNIYMNKAFYEQIAMLTGEVLPPSFEALEVDYIGVGSSAEEVEAFLALYQDQAYQEQMLAMYEAIGALLNIDIPIVQENDTYHIVLDELDTFDLIINGADNVVANLMPLNQMLGLQMTQEEIAVLQSEYALAKDDFVTDIQSILVLIEGGLQLSTTFEEEKTTMTVNFNVQPDELFRADFEQIFGGPLKYELTGIQTVTQLPVQPIEMPENKVLLTEAQLNELLGQATQVIEEVTVTETPVEVKP